VWLSCGQSVRDSLLLSVIRLKDANSSADQDTMTLPFLSRRPAPRRRIVTVTDTWRRTDAGDFRRLVLVRDVDGGERPALLPDAHPALVRFLARVAA
jgi:hypothetical protein